MDTGTPQRLIIVSNRLPFTAVEESDGLHFTESAGGLVSGLNAFLQTEQRPSRDYIWVGWPGGSITDAHRNELRVRAMEYRSHPVFLTGQEMESFYLGFCNKTIWPLFHYFPSYACYEEEFWQQYVHVNRVFCEAVMEVVTPGDMVWVHDYHLMLLPGMLRTRMADLPIGFFLHIPFPSFEVFRLLPAVWRREILEGMLGAHLNGFHTYDYTQHFLQCTLRILGYDHHMGDIATPEGVVRTGTFPMGIDFGKFARTAALPAVREERARIRRNMQQPGVILSVDRLDYSKGILNRLLGYRRLLEMHPEFREHVVLVMVVIPSRVGVDQYETMKKQIEEYVGRINGEFGGISWTPIVYQFKAVSFESLVALYGVSNVALVTPLRDGMNLVAKEYIATRTDRTGVLVLSEMAGAAKELGEAIIINPNNTEEIAEALADALRMPVDEQERRNTIMQARLRRYDIVRWAGEFVAGLGAAAGVQQRLSARLLTVHTKQAIREDYARAANRLIFLDYDGTLVPHVRTPRLAVPGPGVLRVLSQLLADAGNTLVLISGRERETLEHWFGGLPIGLVAEHGIWIRKPGREWEMLHPYANEWKPKVSAVLQSFADRLPGSFVEEKEYALAWHYRSAHPEQAHVLVGELMDHLVHLAANIDVQIMRGNKVVEVHNTGATKGSAALYWAGQGHFDFIAAIGDDASDEEMFMVLPDTAWSIRVGIAGSRARFSIRNPADVLEFLDGLSQTLVAKPVAINGK